MTLYETYIKEYREKLLQIVWSNGIPIETWQLGLRESYNTMSTYVLHVCIATTDGAIWLEVIPKHIWQALKDTKHAAEVAAAMMALEK